MLSSLFDAVGLILNISGIATGAALIVMQKQLKSIIAQMNSKIKQHQTLIDSSGQYSQRIKIMASQHLKVQQNKVNIILAVNNDQIIAYYKRLALAMKGSSKTQIAHSLSGGLPGLSTIQIISQYIEYGFYGIGIVLTIWSVKKNFENIKNFMDSKLIKSALGSALSKTNSNATIRLSKSLNVGPPLGGWNLSLLKLISLSIPFRGQFAKLSNVFKAAAHSQGLFFKATTRTFTRILKVGVFIVGIVSLVFGIAELINLGNKIDEAKKQFELLKKQLNDFYQECLGILYNIKDFLNSLESSFFSISTYLDAIMVTCTHNLYTVTSQAQIQRISKQISQLQLKSISATTFKSIETEKNKMSILLKDLRITETQTSQIENGQKKKIYSTQHSFETITQKFTKMTKIIINLDNQINIVKIFEEYYSKLNSVQLLMKDLDFKAIQLRAKQVLSFKNTFIRSQGNINMLLSNLQTIYITNHYQQQPEHELNQFDRRQIAKMLSLFTDELKGQNNTIVTHVFGYKLSSFKIKLPQGQIINNLTPIQDRIMDEMMGQWPKLMTNQSIIKIKEKIKNQSQNQQFEDKNFMYISSSIYMQELNKLSDIKFELCRVQVFRNKSKKANDLKKTIYVLYDSLTNAFIRVAEGFLKKPQNTKEA